MRNFHVADGLHSFLALFLFVEELFLAADVAAVALGEHILAAGLHIGAGDDLAADGGLDGHIEHLLVDHFLHLLTERKAQGLALAAVHHDGQRVHGIAVYQDVHLHQVGFGIVLHVVVEAGVALGHGLELVVEIQHHLVQGQFIDQHHAILAHIFELLLEAPPFLAELDQAAHEIRPGEDRGLDDGFFDLHDLRERRQLGRIVHGDLAAIGQVDVEPHAGRSGDEIQIEFPLQPLLDDLHVEQTQEAAAQTEAQRRGGFRLIGEAAVVEAQLLHGVAQVLEIVAGGGEDARKHDGLDLLEALQHLGRGLGRQGHGVGHRIADLHIHQLPDVRHQVAHLAHR